MLGDTTSSWYSCLSEKSSDRLSSTEECSAYDGTFPSSRSVCITSFLAIVFDENFSNFTFVIYDSDLL